ncbi:hypothetical protein NPIL_648581 [Nephila pilipes]|uniref:Uncharacterized protein n=1 Tax=Nephila pilipes TaxID=299642 RepID=A0A8X6NVU3_NEPPI|nr:hypothetical protein NPIL_648581 [Nephila pilipes]
MKPTHLIPSLLYPSLTPTTVSGRNDRNLEKNIKLKNPLKEGSEAEHPLRRGKTRINRSNDRLKIQGRKSFAGRSKAYAVTLTGSRRQNQELWTVYTEVQGLSREQTEREFFEMSEMMKYINEFYSKI